MVVRSLFTGVSGLQAHFDKMDTLSNNISNVNTPGFKKSNVVFKSFLSQQIATASSPSAQRGGTNPQSVGLGVDVGSVNLDMSQGQLQRTGVNTDLALQGDGFFTVREAGTSRNLYTRAGSFQFDSQGKLVDPSNGNVVQGYNAEVDDGEIQPISTGGQPGDVQIGTDKQTIPGQATTFQDIAGNLDANANRAIDPVTVNYGSGTEVEFQFERVHPDKNYFKFNAVWKSNPPSGKQVGAAVEDKITGENVSGILELDDSGQVTGVFHNPNENARVGATQVEADDPADNQGTYSINEEEITLRDQQDFLGDLNDFNGELRILVGAQGNPGGPDASGDPNGNGNVDEFIVQWQDEDGNWNDFNLNGAGEHSLGSGDGYGEFGSDFTLTRDTGAGNERSGEIEIDSGFWGSVTNPGAGDVIYFQSQQSDNNQTGLLNLSGEELKEEFRWGGPNGGSFRVSTPENTSGNGSLARVFNYDEANLGDITNQNSINDIPNKEFQIDFSVGGAGDFQVLTDGGNGAFADALEDQNGNNVMNINEDHRLFLPAAAPNNTTGTPNDLGLSIASEDWSTTTTPTGTFEFTVTEARSQDTTRPYVIAQDGSTSNNTTAIFGPGGTASNPSSIDFTPNTIDDTGILNNTAGGFANLLRSSGSGATATKRADNQVQEIASSDVFDSRGNEHTLNYTFEKKDENTWLWHALNPTPLDSDNPQMAGFGTVTFNEDGQLQGSEVFTPKTAEVRPDAGPTGDLDDQGGVYFDPPEALEPPATGAAPVEISPDFSNLTQFGGETSTQIADQDGNSKGQLTSLSFDQTGTVQGSYDNGERRELAQLAVSSFRNPEGLAKEGGTLFSESANSGIAQFGTAGEGARGNVTPGALERSNVELSAQFTQVISTQRGFQANTRTITTSDQMVQSVLQLI